MLMLLMLVHGRVGAEHTPPQHTLQPTMQALFQALTQVFPWSLEAQQFAAPEQRPRIQAALRLLAEHASELETHRQDVPLSFDFLRRTLAWNTRDAAQRYEQGQYQQARFAVQQLTEQCFACHSRLPNLQPFDLGKQFLAATPLERLPLRDRLKLEVATRQFDTAVTTCEALIRSPDLPAADIWLTGVFEDYLKLMIRVRNYFPGAITTLEAFLLRPDVPASVRAQLVDWVDTLKELKSYGPTTNALARARTLIEAGQRRNRFPADQQGLVHFIVASSLLHRYVDAQAPNTQALVEAYYLLGVAESYISRTSWVAETPYFLETAIRLDPKSPTAAMAYDFLNAYMIAAYTGSAGVHLPHEMLEYLDGLRRLRNGS
jgi:hypothetical protein